MKKETYEEQRKRNQRDNESQDARRKEKTLEEHPFRKEQIKRRPE